MLSTIHVLYYALCICLHDLLVPVYDHRCVSSMVGGGTLAKMHWAESRATQLKSLLQSVTQLTTVADLPM